MANVKLTHDKTDRVIEVPEESAQPYIDLGWHKDGKAKQSSSSNSKSGK